MSSYAALETLLRGVRHGSDAGAWRTIIDYLGRADYHRGHAIAHTLGGGTISISCPNSDA